MYRDIHQKSAIRAEREVRGQMEKVAVLVVGFNRPDLLAEVLAAVAAHGPRALYFYCDGPRKGIELDHGLVQETRDLVNQFRWDCEVHTNFQETNQGLRKSMVSAIDWVFSFEDKAIVLEDDCLPSSGFFPFMERFLQTYERDSRVWGVTGSNAAAVKVGSSESITFVSTALIWGWATWADRWQKYDRDLSVYRDLSDKSSSKWRDIEDFHVLDWRLRVLLQTDASFSWASQWAWTVVYYGGLWAVPNRNMIANLGFRADATNTLKRVGSDKVILENGEFYPPKEVALNYTAHHDVNRRIHGLLVPLWLNYPANWLRRIRLQRRLAPKTRIQQWRQTFRGWLTS